MEVHQHPDLEHKKKKFREYLLEFLMIFLAVTLVLYLKLCVKIFVTGSRSWHDN